MTDAAATTYPPSPVIHKIIWAPPATINRQGAHSDTWPITWADDGNQYLSWADGTGFEHDVPRLSLGLGKVVGDPPHHRGLDIRSETGEDAGDGASGMKASGMLMVGGVLYMWARNSNKNGAHSRLAWSADHARTWEWAEWSFEQFGCCTFLNFGRNYAGARDGYVYVYSHDSPSAYTPADRMILTRVPAGRIAERNAYEFFQEPGTNGSPAWTADVAQRGAVFSGRCRRSSISYNAGIGRYLWWQMRHEDGLDNRFVGGFTIYDGPEPWGPWTVAYSVERWDVGPGESAHFPTKWMSSDGRTIHLVFSGDDTFAVRRATLELAR